jgi:hypothetical protein
MSVLQAARAYSLGLPLESAYSWGLNRAIFIAAAKRGFKGGGRTKRTETQKISNEQEKPSKETYYLGDDMAYKDRYSKVLRFKIGGKVQKKEDFEKQVVKRFGDYSPKAWKESIAYIKKFDKDTLLSGNEFYNVVYKPKRDEFAKKWTEAIAAEE